MREGRGFRRVEHRTPKRFKVSTLPFHNFNTHWTIGMKSFIEVTTGIGSRMLIDVDMVRGANEVNELHESRKDYDRLSIEKGTEAVSSELLIEVAGQADQIGVVETIQDIRNKLATLEDVDLSFRI